MDNRPPPTSWSGPCPIRDRRSGVLTVSYDIVNVTSQTTTVSYEDATGAQRTEAITQAVPMAGALSLTLPKDASAIDAPGAALTPGASGVGASWTIVLAPPLSPVAQSVSYSMNVTDAEIPRAKLAIGVIVPAEPASEAAPAALGRAVTSFQTAAQAQLAQVQAQARDLLARVQADLAGLDQVHREARTQDSGASDNHSDDLVRLSDRELASLSQTSTADAARCAAQRSGRRPRDFTTRWVV